MERVVASRPFATPDALGARLRHLFPKVLVRARLLTGEGNLWYIYRDGGWRPDDAAWWDRPNVPMVEATDDGVIVEATPGARGLLGIGPDDGPHHFAEFTVAEAVDDATALFEIVRSGHDLNATVRVRPLNGDVFACEIHSTRRGDRIVTYLRLADDVAARVPQARALPRLLTRPEADVVFARYAEEAIQTISEPTPDELAVRLRRLYPHAQVVAAGDAWIVQRDRAPVSSGSAEWWEDATLARVRYDEQGLILDANEAARRLINPTLVGHHWHDFVTPGSTEQVGAVIEMIRTAGWAVSRFRMPSADGTLIEFDSYTRVDADGLTTIMRPVTHESDC